MPKVLVVVEKWIAPLRERLSQKIERCFSKQRKFTNFWKYLDIQQMERQRFKGWNDDPIILSFKYFSEMHYCFDIDCRSFHAPPGSKWKVLLRNIFSARSVIKGFCINGLFATNLFPPWYVNQIFLDAMVSPASTQLSHS